MSNVERKLTKARVLEVAKSFFDIKTFRKSHPEMLRFAQRKGFISQLEFSSRQPRMIYDLKSVVNIAKRFHFRSDFHEGAPGAYWWAVKHKCLSVVCSHMPSRKPSNKSKWNIDNLRKAAEFCKTRSELSNINNAAYTAALRLGLLDELFPLSEEKTRKKWNESSVREALSHYSSRKDLCEKDQAAYTAARRYNLLDEIFPNEIVRKYWDEESAFKAAKRFSSISELANNYNGAYQWLRRNGYSKDLKAMYQRKNAMQPISSKLGKPDLDILNIHQAS